MEVVEKIMGTVKIVEKLGIERRDGEGSRGITIKPSKI